MAERRMFAKSVIDSDLFLDMPMSAQALYFHLAMRADDDGFVNNPKKIKRMIGASDDDFKILLAKSFLIPFESGIVVIRHWKVHNYIQKDRYAPTLYEAERSNLTLSDKGIYETSRTECIQGVYKLDTQDSIGKLSTVKDNVNGISNEMQAPAQAKPKKRFQPPTVEEVRTYCKERKNSVDPEQFVNYYSANGWVQGRGKPIKDWKAAVRTWERNGYNNGKAVYDTFTADDGESPTFGGTFL